MSSAITISVAAADPSQTFPAPVLEYSRLAPMLLVFGVAVLGVLVEAFVARRFRYPVQLGLSLLGIAGGLVAVGRLAGTTAVAAEGSVAVDGPTLFLQATILLLAGVSLLLVGERALDPAGDAFAAAASAVPGSPGERLLTEQRVTQTEVYPLVMFAVGGMLLFPAANDLLTLFVALEVLSLPLYLLCAMARRRRLLSQEAGLKYFLLGAFSSAFLLFGSAFLYGYSGSLRFSGIADAVSDGASNDALLLLGTALVGVGLFFKIGAVPFHAWTPDVYQGAPTPITALMAAGTKVAAFGALLRVFYVALGGAGWDWRPMIWAVSILTMVVGSVLALTQDDVKRMLAYSSIAHAGFLLTGVAALSSAGVAGVLFYLLAYGFTTVGAFGVVMLVRTSVGEATALADWAGLGRRSPLVAGVFTLFLLALTGIPLTGGFTSKFAVFSAALSGGATVLVLVGVLASAVAAFFYGRVIVLMFFSEPGPAGGAVVIPSVLTSVVVAAGAAVTVVLGVAPQPLLDLATSATGLVR